MTDQTRKSLDAVREMAQLILDEWASDRYGRPQFAVNWKSLKVLDIGVSEWVGIGKSVELLVSEASPRAFKFQMALADEVRRRLPELNTDYVITVHTEL